MLSNISQTLSNFGGNAAPQQAADKSLDKSLTEKAGSLKKSTTEGEAREAFDKFVGNTFYGQMLKAMRSTVDKPAYFHGGRAEEMFQSQLDQVVTDHMTEASAGEFSGGMFDQFWNDLSQNSRL